MLSASHLSEALMNPRTHFITTGHLCNRLNLMLGTVISRVDRLEWKLIILIQWDLLHELLWHDPIYQKISNRSAPIIRCIPYKAIKPVCDSLVRIWQQFYSFSKDTKFFFKHCANFCCKRELNFRNTQVFRKFLFM